jgi:hypothetical protein
MEDDVKTGEEFAAHIRFISQVTAENQPTVDLLIGVIVDKPVKDQVKKKAKLDPVPAYKVKLRYPAFRREKDSRIVDYPPGGIPNCTFPVPFGTRIHVLKKKAIEQMLVSGVPLNVESPENGRLFVFMSATQDLHELTKTSMLWQGLDQADAKAKNDFFRKGSQGNELIVHLSLQGSPGILEYEPGEGKVEPPPTPPERRENMIPITPLRTKKSKKEESKESKEKKGASRSMHADNLVTLLKWYDDKNSIFIFTTISTFRICAKLPRICKHLRRMLLGRSLTGTIRRGLRIGPTTTACQCMEGSLVLRSDRSAGLHLLTRLGHLPSNPRIKRTIRGSVLLKV